MKTKITALVALTLIGLNAFAIPHETGGLVVPMGVEIRYSSIGTGIDSSFKAEVENLLVMKKVTNELKYVKESNWGMEGESTVCLQFYSYSVADQALQQILEVKNKVSSKYTEVRAVGTCDEDTSGIGQDPRALK